MGYDPRADLDRDGDIDSNDSDAFYESYGIYGAGAGQWKLSDGTGLNTGKAAADGLDNRFGWRGYWWDQKLQQYHVRNRDYDPREGRWLQTDPIGFDGGDQNLYRYSSGDYSMGYDPEGLYGIGDWFHDMGDGFRAIYGGDSGQANQGCGTNTPGVSNNATDIHSGTTTVTVTQPAQIAPSTVTVTAADPCDRAQRIANALKTSRNAGCASLMSPSVRNMLPVSPAELPHAVDLVGLGTAFGSLRDADEALRAATGNGGYPVALYTRQGTLYSNRGILNTRTNISLRYVNRLGTALGVVGAGFDGYNAYNYYSNGYNASGNLYTLSAGAGLGFTFGGGSLVALSAKAGGASLGAASAGLWGAVAYLTIESLHTTAELHHQVDDQLRAAANSVSNGECGFLIRQLKQAVAECAASKNSKANSP